MRIEKVGMKELDRHLGKILGQAQKGPVIVYMRGVPSLCIVPDFIWERPNPWGSLLPPEHRLVVLRAQLDAKLGHEQALLTRIANDVNSLVAAEGITPVEGIPRAEGICHVEDLVSAEIIVRVLAFKVLRNIRSKDYLLDQIKFNMSNRWFVGLPVDCRCVEAAVYLAWQLSLKPWAYVFMTKLVAGLAFDTPSTPRSVRQRALFGNESPQHFVA